ncbi:MULTISPECIES: ABC transporter ATP-binding protein [Streptomyces]|uniref:ABC transporter ATP-binding protein n=1 Tax=Streptomyces sudanensis TaxID=436397 RepID=A0ABY4TEC1_9ACTN|nr:MULTISPECIES: ABC transporter ATP-binding protein [Streptomyces]MCP9956902.1 ABC transporter ATP-binding protein [Streptomyces sudanensis]MCP9986088.1 ABC transporter ATP-binding protein [Streptomyces sudanensis]MCQ0002516.1 ABC transporter ATP-binding protein [Streptomyces sudanensis]URN17284.1 ABC transporter ATP-binding protein [Streptomyces sudanensis]
MNYSAPDAPALVLRDVTKNYGSKENSVQALRGISVELARGSFTAVMGPSGSGKSTFLHCAAGLDRPSGGEVRLGGVSLSGMGETELTGLRRDRIGFVFQAYNLLPSLSVQDNITMPLRLSGASLDRAWLEEITERVGLTGRLRRRPSELSGGQQQRVAIARALISRPDVIMADEPTGALDSHTGKEVLRLFQELVHELGQTVLMVTHDPVAASYAHSVLFLADGRLVERLDSPTAETVAERMARLGGR